MTKEKQHVTEMPIIEGDGGPPAPMPIIEGDGGPSAPMPIIEGDGPPATGITPELYAQIRADLLKDIMSEEEKKKQALIEARENEKLARTSYVEKMKDSTDPWVDIIGWVDTGEGVRVELDWNQAFVNMLVEAGYVGRSDEMIVQQWITILLRDMADRMEDRNLYDDIPDAI
jgi:hypothetical protein